MGKSRDKTLSHYYCLECGLDRRFFSAIWNHFRKTGHLGYRMTSPSGKHWFTNKPTKKERDEWRRLCESAETLR